MRRILAIARSLNWPRIAILAVVLLLAFAFWGELIPALARAVTHHG